jgi:hypothetical protein
MSTDERIERDYLRLRSFLKTVLGRLRTLRVIEGLILVVAGAAMVFLTGAFSLAVHAFLPYAPFVVSIISLLLFAFLIALAAVRVIRVPSVSAMARYVEKKVPDLKDNLTNSLALFHSDRTGTRNRELSRSLVAAQMAKTSRQVSPISPGQIIELNRVSRYAKMVIPVILVFIGTWVLSPSSLVRSWNLLARPWASLPPRVTYLDITPKGATLARGSQFLITASTWGKIPEEMSLKVWTESGREAVTAMEKEGKGRFRYTLYRVDESFHYQASSRGYDSPVYRAHVVPLPEVAGLRITSFPPEYSRLPSAVQTGGHISALKGTVVKLDITPTKEISEGKIVLSRKNVVPLKKTDSPALEGSLVLLSEGAYHIELKDQFGFTNPSPLRYQIRLIPDEAPRVEIVDPAHDRQVTGNETLPLVYNAHDDFGITEIRLGFRVTGKKEHKIVLWKGSGEKTFSLKLYRWDLDSLVLSPGDRLEYWLEVVDNDTISGFKEGYSQILSLIVKDFLKAVEERNQGIREIADALLDLLADHLESSAGAPPQTTLTKKELTERAREILKKVDENLARFDQERDVADPARYDMEMLQRNLAAAVERMENQEHETITSRLERMALLAEDIAKRARMEDVQALAQDIRNRERRLLSRLEELQNNLTDAGRAEALEELAKLQELLNKLMNALSQMADKLPDDFVNSDALKGMEFQDMFQGLEEIAEKLREGDLDGALQAARDLLQSLGQMLAALSQAGMESQMAEFGRLRSEMTTNESELSKIIAEQQEVLLKTEELNRSLEKRVEAFVAQKLEALREDLRDVVRKLEKILPRIEERGMAMEMERSLDQGNLGKFTKYLDQLGERLGVAGASDAQSQALLAKLKALMKALNPEPSELARKEEKKQLTELARREKSLQERTHAIRERLALLSQVFPIVDPRLMEDIGQASELMGQAQGKLENHDPPGAIPPEREALKRLTKSQRGMRALSQQMARRMGRYAQRLAWGFDPWPGWYSGRWLPLPSLPQPSLKGFRRDQGYTGIRREEFPTPSKDAHQVPKMYREEIMEALKEGFPSEYQKQVNKYFQNLAE